MSTLGVYGFRISAKQRLAQYHLQNLQFIRIPSEMPKEASQTIEDLKKLLSIYNKEIHPLRLILHRELTSFREEQPRLYET